MTGPRRRGKKAGARAERIVLPASGLAEDILALPESAAAHLRGSLPAAMETS